MEKEILKRLEAMEAEIKVLKGGSKSVQPQGTQNGKWLDEVKAMPKNHIHVRGNFHMEGSGSDFGVNTNFENVLAFDNDKTAKVLNALSSSERILILKELLKKSSTVAELMKACSFKTTGQAYHHLNALEKSGLIQKDKDTYHFEASLISSFLLILTGVQNFFRGSPKKAEFDVVALESQKK
ncbi:MAG: winged helix-turn-helix domain-containing protein [Firmicutes bacterium]|nr:winged helix-turn-helix domain-containing protein [Bacillota bacterium]